MADLHSAVPYRTTIAGAGLQARKRIIRLTDAARRAEDTEPSTLQHLNVDFAVGRVAMRSKDRVRSHAVKVVQDAMASCAVSFDWSGWMVDVHDADGRCVLLLEFAESVDAAEPCGERMAA